MTRFDEKTTIRGMEAGKIARVVEAEGSVFVGKCHAALLAIVQAMRDMHDSGLYGKELSDVLRVHFCPPDENCSRECLEAVYEVFVGGKVRCDDWRILQFRSFGSYGKENGLPDTAKLRDLFERFVYLGSDGISPRWGHFYFGRRRLHCIQVGAYLLPANAMNMCSFVTSLGLPVRLRKEGVIHRVYAGNYVSAAEAHDAAVKLGDKFPGAFAAEVWEGE